MIETPETPNAIEPKSPAPHFQVKRLVRPKVIAYGGGTNSTALLVGLHERKERPDYIVFADTGGEKPWTYDYLGIIDDWCKKVGFPRLTIVKGCYPRQILDGTLENELLRLGCLPAKALGYGTCSEKWKIAPQNKWAKNMGFDEPEKMIGFDFGEPDRAEKAKAEKGWIKTFPLMRWFWGRAECVAAIARAGLPQPGKSACFFCPSSSKAEILALPEELQERALEIERRAMTADFGPTYTNVKGLGRQFAWAELIDYHRRQLPLFGFADPPPMECNCYD